MYLDPTHEAVAAFLQRGLTGPVDMLNLLRFREVADYSDSPELAPESPISGIEAYQRYMAHTTPFLVEAGGALRLMGEGGQLLIGPADERWDIALIVRHSNPKAFLDFASNEAYLAGLGHRTAALEDSRLLPLVTQKS